MRIFVYASGAGIKKLFSKVKGKDASVEFMDPPSLKSSLKDIPAGSLVYVDLSSLKPADIAKAMKLLHAAETLLWGVIDPKGIVKDSAEIFHRGGADYIGKELAKAPVNSARFTAVSNFLHIESGDDAPARLAISFKPSGRDWKEVKEGKEYTFCMIFIELDNQAVLRKNASDKQLGEVMRTFQGFVQKTMSNLNGRIWMWADFCGLVLIPFDGERCEAVLTCLRLQMNRTIISLEECDLGICLSYRIALHIGNTVYRSRGETGSIISDSINSIFHLGQKFARPGQLVLTENIEPFIPSGVKDLFINDGIFEGRMIYRLIFPK
ncbi:MAG: hypothetical protein C4529_02890 [Deltaproteobacteria bacterium]|nr:MAG: hypothetical protein C4529_02890 [Deltaproteobacteria bacterium]